jgi:hypothetical protein
VHGFLVDIASGKLEWLVNGYQILETMGGRWTEVMKSGGTMVDAMTPLADFKFGEMKFPETKIGETVVKAQDWLAQKIGKWEMTPATSQPPPVHEPAASVAGKMVGLAEKHWPVAGQAPPKPSPPKLPLPPAIRPRLSMRKDGK